MNSRNFFKVALLSSVAFMWSCTEPVVDPALDQPQSEFFADHSMIATNSLVERLKGDGFIGPNAFIFGRFYSNESARGTTSSPMQMRSELRSASMINARSAQSQCFTESYTENEDGSYEYILDFGDGCDFEGEFMKGKLIETGSYTESTFEDHIEFIGFGGDDWEISGTEDYIGTYSETEVNEDSVTWSASYSFTSDLEEKFIDFGYDADEDVSTGEQLIELIYVASGEEYMDHLGFIVNSGNESIVVSTGEEFTSQIQSPLIMDFACYEEDVWIFTQGVESGTYSYPSGNATDGIITGDYSIDYGSGDCDNIVVFTENGISEEIDLGEEWEDWEEECGDDHEDEGASNG